LKIKSIFDLNIKELIFFEKFCDLIFIYCQGSGAGSAKDPDPHRPNFEDPDPHKVNADPHH